jgi:hypothetical protein
MTTTPTTNPIAYHARRVLIIGTRLAIVCGVAALLIALLRAGASPAPQLSTYAPAPADVRGVAQPALALLAQLRAGGAINPWSLAQVAVVLLACVPLARVVVVCLALARDRQQGSRPLAWCAGLVALLLLAGLAGVPLHA